MRQAPDPWSDEQYLGVLGAMVVGMLGAALGIYVLNLAWEAFASLKGAACAH
jgi:hypothetical protein